MNLLFPSALLCLLTGAALAAPPTRPFPQHPAYTAGSILPKHDRAELDSATADFYRAWKARYFHAGCAPGQAYIFCNVEKAAANKNAISVSEGHGYGMLLTAYFAGSDPEAQSAFDQLYAFFRAHPSQFTADLMAWEQRKGCVEGKDDDDSAADGDFDIAYALLLADRQWGSAGPINYHAEALQVIDALKRGDLNTDVPSVKPGDWARGNMSQVNDYRLSDFMPDHFRSFAKASGDPVWDPLLNGGYSLVAHLQSAFAPDTGLIPDFVRNVDTASPAPAGRHFLESAYDGQYFYNACRCPWRISMDYLLSGEARSKEIVEKLTAFMERSTKGDPDFINAGYFLTGKSIHPDDTSLSFTAPFAVAAMCDPSHQRWLDALWEKMVSVPIRDDDYYGNTVKLLCMVAVSGNWWSP